MPAMATGAGTSALPLLALVVVAAAGYLAAAAVARGRRGWWPAGRALSWCTGLAAVAAAMSGPLGGAAHRDFAAHMIVHLVLGMAAPLLLVAAAPVTVALRALPVVHARRLSWLLRSRPVRVITHPVTAAALDAGGLWVLYTTGLYHRTTEQPWLHTLVHLHVLLAGYLFTAAIIGLDPAPHRPGPRTRAVVLLAFLAAHGILAKYLYAHPPTGVPAVQAQHAAMIMYYGGDLLDLALIITFCRQWYTAVAPAGSRRRWQTVIRPVGEGGRAPRR